ncbi:unnamed protein product [Effrenium voratum]|nr:unnamed protein product [Effrenium voratum]
MSNSGPVNFLNLEDNVFVRTGFSRETVAACKSSKGVKMLVAGTIALGAFHTVLIKASFGRFIMSCMLSYWLITHCKKLLSPAFTSPYVFVGQKACKVSIGV